MKHNERIRLDRIEELLEKLAIQKKTVLTVKELSAHTGWSESYIYKLCSAEKIPFSKYGKNSYFDRAKIETLLLSNEQGLMTETVGINQLVNLKNRKR